MDWTFNFWENSVAIFSAFTSLVTAWWLYKLSKSQSARDRYEHEVKITQQIHKIKLFQEVILADVKKYKPDRTDKYNKTYVKQKGEVYTIIPEYGVQVVLMPSNELIPVGLIPFEWIEYVRGHDSEDNRHIIVCKFKGVKWYKNFKSPFKTINHLYNNKSFVEGENPDFMRLANILN